jgi:hypothetical protein
MQKSLQRKTGQLFDTLKQASVTLAQVTRSIPALAVGCEPFLSPYGLRISRT